MFAYLKGLLAVAHPTHVIVDIHGIGYLLSVPGRLSGTLPAIGQPVEFHTSFVVREFAHTLYGFLTSQERDLFEVLMNITGIGPKLALSLIGHLSFEELQAAVTRPDLTVLCRVPGVGKKTAERLIVELKDKLPNLWPVSASFASALPASPMDQAVQDAMLALIHLGYNQNTAQKAIKQSLKELPEKVDVSTLITMALKKV